MGCGSGLSGQALEDAGHYWIGCDISTSMLEVKTLRYYYSCDDYEANDNNVDDLGRL